MSRENAVISNTDLPFRLKQRLLQDLPSTTREVMSLLVNHIGDQVHVHQLVDSKLHGGSGTFGDVNKLALAMVGIENGLSRAEMEGNFEIFINSSSLDPNLLSDEIGSIWNIISRHRDLMNGLGFDVLGVINTETYIFARRIPDGVKFVRLKDRRPVPDWLSNWQTTNEIKYQLLKAFVESQKLNLSTKFRAKTLTEALDTDSFILLYELAQSRVNNRAVKIDNLNLTQNVPERKAGLLLRKVRSKLVRFFSKNNIDLSIERSSDVILLRTKKEMFASVYKNMEVVD